MSIAAYNGISIWPSWFIKKVNDGDRSHVSWVDDEKGDVYEAWTSGVRRVPSIHHDHTPGTPVDIFSVQGEDIQAADLIRRFMTSQIGKPYDWPGVFRFVTRGKEIDTDYPPHWFCSRLVACAYRKAGLPLLYAPDWKINPTDCTTSLRCGPAPVRSLVTINTSLLDNRDVRGYERDPDETLWVKRFE